MNDLNFISSLFQLKQEFNLDFTHNLFNNSFLDRESNISFDKLGEDVTSMHGLHQAPVLLAVAFQTKDGRVRKPSSGNIDPHEGQGRGEDLTVANN